MRTKLLCLVSLILSVSIFTAVSVYAQPDGAQTGISTMQSARKKPVVIIYTLSTCPHCMEAKEFFTRNHIPFVNREVDTDSRHMDDLMRIYDKMAVPDEKRGVPLILIGDDVRLQGFNRAKVEEALKKVLPE